MCVSGNGEKGKPGDPSRDAWCWRTTGSPLKLLVGERLQGSGETSGTISLQATWGAVTRSCAYGAHTHKGRGIISHSAMEPWDCVSLHERQAILPAVVGRGTVF